MLLCIKDDSFLVETDKTLMENTLKLGTKGFLAGVVTSLYTLNNNFTSRPLLNSMGIMFGRYALPFGATAAVFASTTSLMDDWRGKNKAHTNAAIGGFLGGIVYGSKYRSPSKCLTMGLQLAALAFIVRLGLTMDSNSVKKTEIAKLNDQIYISSYANLRN